MTAQPRVISGAKRHVTFLWLIGVAGLGAVAVYKDFTSSGLQETLLFRSIGYMVYPVFYGGVAYLLYRFGSLLAKGDAYLTASDDLITVGGKELSTAGLDVAVRRNWLGLREVGFFRNGQREFAVKGYFLSRSLDEVVTELKHVLGKGG